MDLNDKVEKVGVIGNQGGAGKAGVPTELVDIIAGLREATRAASMARSEGSMRLRADAIYRGVMEKLQKEEERRRKSWSARMIRFLNRVAASAAGLWNSRAVRSLVP